MNATRLEIQNLQDKVSQMSIWVDEAKARIKELSKKLDSNSAYSTYKDDSTLCVRAGEPWTAFERDLINSELEEYLDSKSRQFGRTQLAIAHAIGRVIQKRGVNLRHIIRTP